MMNCDEINDDVCIICQAEHTNKSKEKKKITRRGMCAFISLLLYSDLLTRDITFYLLMSSLLPAAQGEKYHGKNVHGRPGAKEGGGEPPSPTIPFSKPAPPQESSPQLL